MIAGGERPSLAPSPTFGYHRREAENRPPGVPMAITSFRFVPLALALAGLLACSTTSTVGGPPRGATAAAPGREDARRLAAGGHLEEAVAVYERLTAQRPDDAPLCAEAARSMLELAPRLAPEKAQPLRKRARALAARARQLGDESPYVDTVLRSVREDGTVAPRPAPRFSTDPTVQQAIVDGEGAFERGEMDAALRSYARALELEPRNYWATLWTGDVHFKAERWDAAAEWFRKAVDLDGDVELGHRYLADVLRRVGKQEEALDQYVEAVIADPQSAYARHMLKQFVQKMPKPPIPVLPREAVEIAGRRIEFGGPGGRRGLAEEVAGLRTLAAVNADQDAWREKLTRLAVIRDAGLLEPYVVLERTGPEVARDYPAYREGHRKELRRYLRVYWCGLD